MLPDTLFLLLSSFLGNINMALGFGLLLLHNTASFLCLIRTRLKYISHGLSRILLRIAKWLSYPADLKG